MCKISVIMPVYNEKVNWLKKSIESICNQTFTDFEFIIILDNPNNKELEYVINEAKKNDSRIQFYKNEINMGLVSTLNRGLKLSKGQFIARMDADDISHSSRFEKQIKFLEQNTEVGLVGTNWDCIDENGNILFKHGELPIKYTFIKNNIKYNNMFLHPSWMFRREILSVVDGYRELTFCEDYDFITRLLTNNIIITNINEYLMLYRVRSNSISISKAYEQYLNSVQVIKYMKERRKFDIDSYCNNNIVIDENRKYAFMKATNLFMESRHCLSNKQYVKFIVKFIASLFISRDRFRKNSNLIIFNIKLYLQQKLNLK